jgi:adenylate cyclase
MGILVGFCDSFRLSFGVIQDSFSFIVNDFGALWMLGRYEEAIAAGREARNRGPNDIFSHLLLALTYIELGRVEDAQLSAAEVLRIKPNCTLEWLAKLVPWKNKNDLNRLIENLRKAGLPEK